MNLYKKKKGMPLALSAVLIFAIIFTFVVSFSHFWRLPFMESSVKKETTAAPSAVEINTDVAEGSLKIDAKSAVLLDADSGMVIYEQNSHEQLPPASVTKIMTMLLSLEAVENGQIKLRDEVTISERAASMGGSQMYMEAGETQSVENLLKGMAICSANDA
ncbi:D-alanyl-D-alanine carboxypeptidase family protein [Sinanaerobacter sp. ZZT-01]|uniref:D-alanyl-D-alanine carboxypeptidase family protein n=1 Tax=Sinanaerobacter sp. ZZT-01 TaxID=3111540 RepID=UPI003A97A877